MTPMHAPAEARVELAPTRRRFLDTLRAATGAACCLALAPSWAQPGERLKVPIGMGGKAGLPFVTQLLELIGQAANIEWQIQIVPFARHVMMAERGELMAFGLSRSEPRERLFEFSNALFNNHVWMVVQREKVFNYRQLNDLRERVVCLPRGTVMGPEFEAFRSQLPLIKQTDGDIAARARMVLAGRCDVLLASYRSAHPESVTRLLSLTEAEIQGLVALPKPMEISPVYMAAARGSELAARVLPRVNAALRQQARAIESLINSDI